MSGTLPPDHNKGPGILAVTWAECGVALVVLSLRLYTRARIVRNVSWDDWIMVFATVLAIITSVIVQMEVHYGVGRHAMYIPPPDLIQAVKYIWLSTPFSTMSACFGKISIALLLLRMINRNKWQQSFLWTLIVLLFVINLVLTIVTFAQCTPVTYLWDQFNPHVPYKGHCWNPNVQKYYGYFQGAFSSFSDLVLALFPMLIIKDLQMELKLKFALAIVMGLGIVATVGATIKTVELRNLSTPDFTWNATNLVYWYISENWLIIIAACIPTLAPLYFVVLGKRTKESFQVTPGRGGSGRSWLRSWRIRSPIVSISKLSGSSSKRRSYGPSTMEKGYSSMGPSMDRSFDTERSQTELVPSKPGNANITRTTEVTVS